MNRKEYLENKYLDTSSPIILSGSTKIHLYLKKKGYAVGLLKIIDWLQDQDSYSLQRSLRHSFKRNRIISHGIDFLWDTDLAMYLICKSIILILIFTHCHRHIQPIFICCTVNQQIIKISHCWIQADIFQK